MISGNFRAFSEQLSDYTGTFEDAKECTLNIEATALDTITRAIKDAVLKMFRNGIAHGYAEKDAVACVNDLL